MSQKTILVVDDDPKICKFLVNYLTREGYIVDSAHDGDEALVKFQEVKPNLIILDVMMPGKDGFEVCKQIRETSQVPIIFLSAKTDTEDRVMGLATGSDDYLTKPFDNAELLLRIRAILRRVEENIGVKDQEITVSGLEINRKTHQVKVNGREVELTGKEFELLWLLAENPNQVFTRDQLIYQVWDSYYTGDTGIVTTLVKRLREKIEDDPANPQYIKTNRGVGYKLGLK